MIGIFSKLKNVVEKNKLEKLRKQAKPYFDFISFLKVCDIRFYQEVDLGEMDGGKKLFEIDPTIEEINIWVIKYFEAVKWIKKNKVSK